jgi:hypothetical protein
MRCTMSRLRRSLSTRVASSPRVSAPASAPRSVLRPLRIAGEWDGGRRAPTLLHRGARRLHNTPSSANSVLVLPFRCSRGTAELAGQDRGGWTDDIDTVMAGSPHLAGTNYTASTYTTHHDAPSTRCPDVSHAAQTPARGSLGVHSRVEALRLTSVRAARAS